ETPLPSLLYAAVERALHHGRLLRAQTALGSVTRSIGSLAVDELVRELHEPNRATILVVGAGEVGKLAVRALRRRVGRILVVSRSGQSAQEAAADFMDESAARDAAPVIAALQARADDLRKRQLDRALRKLGHLNQRDREVVAGLAQALARGLIHEPTAALRTKPSRAGAARDLFGIEP